jgi:hypothetical protein
LEGIADSTGYENRAGWVEHGRKHLAEGLAPLAKIDPCPKYGAGSNGDELVPGLGVDAARDAALCVEAHVVLDVTDVRDTQRAHLRTLEVLLKPAAVVTVYRKLDDLEPSNAGLDNG